MIVMYGLRAEAQHLTRLEVGSGNNPLHGYQHADIDPNLPQLDYVCSLEAIPVPDQTFTEVKSVHSIEHVSLGKARAALREWYRILKRDGLVEIDTPNIARNITLYMDGSWVKDFEILTPEQKEACTLRGKPNRTLWLNFKVFSDDNNDTAWNLHKWNADPELLEALMREAGFEDINVLSFSPSLRIVGYRR